MSYKQQWSSVIVNVDAILQFNSQGIFHNFMTFQTN